MGAKLRISPLLQGDRAKKQQTSSTLHLDIATKMHHDTENQDKVRPDDVYVAGERQEFPDGCVTVRLFPKVARGFKDDQVVVEILPFNGVMRSSIDVADSPTNRELPRKDQSPITDVALARKESLSVVKDFLKNIHDAPHCARHYVTSDFVDDRRLPDCVLKTKSADQYTRLAKKACNVLKPSTFVYKSPRISTCKSKPHEFMVGVEYEAQLGAHEHEPEDVRMQFTVRVDRSEGAARICERVIEPMEPLTPRKSVVEQPLLALTPRPSNTKARYDAIRGLRESFASLDSDGSGHLSVNEIVAASKKVGLKFNRAALANDLMHGDLDGDSTFELREVETMLKRQLTLEEAGIEDARRPLIFDVMPLIARSNEAHSLVDDCIRASRLRNAKLERQSQKLNQLRKAGQAALLARMHSAVRTIDAPGPEGGAARLRQRQGGFLLRSSCVLFQSPSLTTESSFANSHIDVASAGVAASFAQVPGPVGRASPSHRSSCTAAMREGQSANGTGTDANREVRRTARIGSSWSVPAMQRPRTHALPPLTPSRYTSTGLLSAQPRAGPDHESTVRQSHCSHLPVSVRLAQRVRTPFAA